MKKDVSFDVKADFIIDDIKICIEDSWGNMLNYDYNQMLRQEESERKKAWIKERQDSLLLGLKV